MVNSLTFLTRVDRFQDRASSVIVETSGNSKIRIKNCHICQKMAKFAHIFLVRYPLYVYVI